VDIAPYLWTKKLVPLLSLVTSLIVFLSLHPTAKEMNDQDHRENDQDHRERESEAEKETAMTETDKSGGISWRVVASGLTTDSSQELPLIKSSKINTK